MISVRSYSAMPLNNGIIHFCISQCYSLEGSEVLKKSEYFWLLLFREGLEALQRAAEARVLRTGGPGSDLILGPRRLGARPRCRNRAEFW